MAVGPTHSTRTLSREECIAHLIEDARGRVLISLRSLPAALPARFSLVNDHLLLTSRDEAVLAAAERHDVISLQVDGASLDGGTWSVTCSGIAEVADDEEPKGDLLIEHLAMGAHRVRLPLTIVSGRHDL